MHLHTLCASLPFPLKNYSVSQYSAIEQDSLLCLVDFSVVKHMLVRNKIFLIEYNIQLSIFEQVMAEWITRRTSDSR